MRRCTLCRHNTAKRRDSSETASVTRTDKRDRGLVNHYWWTDSADGDGSAGKLAERNLLQNGENIEIFTKYDTSIFQSKWLILTCVVENSVRVTYSGIQYAYSELTYKLHTKMSEGIHIIERPKERADEHYSWSDTYLLNSRNLHSNI